MSKGGSTTSSVTIPEYIEAAAQRNLNKAERISQIGYTPYYGPDVAAFTPMQQAAFQGTAQTASAFGLPGGDMSQQDIMGGMPAPTTYAGGVQGYSAAPIYEQSLQTLGERRPGQKAYIDSFFIDPYAGGAAAGNFAPIDYTNYQTGAAAARASAGAGTGAGSGVADYSQVIADEMGMDSFDPYRTAESQMTPEQYAVYQDQPMSNPAQLAAEDIYMSNLGNANSNIIDAGKGLFNVEPSFGSPSSAGSYGGSLVTGGLSGDFTPIPGIAGNVADTIVSNVNPSYAMRKQGENFAETMGSVPLPGGGYDISSWFNDGPAQSPSPFSNPDWKAIEKNFPSAPQQPSGPALGSQLSDMERLNRSRPAPTAQPYSAEANAAAIAAAKAAALTSLSPPGASTSGTENNAQNALNNTASAARSLGLKSKIANNHTLTPAEQAIYNKAIDSGLGWMF